MKKTPKRKSKFRSIVIPNGNTMHTLSIGEELPISILTKADTVLKKYPKDKLRNN